MSKEDGGYYNNFIKGLEGKNGAPGAKDESR